MLHRPATEPVDSQYYLVLFLAVVTFLSSVEVTLVTMRFNQY